MQRDELVNYLADLLQVDSFQDYAPNGLQVEGSPTVEKIIAGVTASQALVDAAVAKGADALLVHHGYFWNGEDPCVAGMKRRRLKALLDAGINLLAYHLPLDAHPQLGNNARLADLLGLRAEGGFGGGNGPDIGLFGEVGSPQSGEAFAALLEQTLSRRPLHIPGPQAEIRRIAWCTGAAQNYIEEAAVLGVDAYLSGEISEQTVHIAREVGIHFYAAGHHATERYGVQAVGVHLADEFGISVEFVDIDNPV